MPSELYIYNELQFFLLSFVLSGVFFQLFKNFLKNPLYLHVNKNLNFGIFELSEMGICMKKKKTFIKHYKTYSHGSKILLDLTKFSAINKRKPDKNWNPYFYDQRAFDFPQLMTKDFSFNLSGQLYILRCFKNKIHMKLPKKIRKTKIWISSSLRKIR